MKHFNCQTDFNQIDDNTLLQILSSNAACEIALNKAVEYFDEPVIETLVGFVALNYKIIIRLFLILMCTTESIGYCTRSRSTPSTRGNNRRG